MGRHQIGGLIAGSHTGHPVGDIVCAGGGQVAAVVPTQPISPQPVQWIPKNSLKVNEQA